jgi:phytoene synthase
VTSIAFFRATMPESSAMATGADDALKDLDNTWFLRGQADDVRAAWFDRIRILRLVDRLAEAERREPAGERFERFQEAFHLLCDGYVTPWRPEIAEIQRLWLSGPELERVSNMNAISLYAEGIADHSLMALPVDDLDHHERVLGWISGGMFQLFPFVRDEDRGPIWHFGILDGFWNNLRDLAEDSAAGLCYFPEDMLREHGLTRDDVLTGGCIGTVGWERMMRFWLDEYLPTLRERAQPFIEATGLHPSLEALREWCLHRYRRVENVFRSVGYDYKAFQVLYWSQVRRELVGEEAA